MKRRANGLLVVTAGVLIGAHAAGHGHGWLAYVQATAEAAMVGGLADWFAVTALFRHPLGVPIPHTAIIRERKDQFAATLGSFVQENFLTPEVVVERVRTARVVDRTAEWLAEPANAATVSRQLADLVLSVTDAVRDDDVHRLMSEALERGLGALPISRLAGHALHLATAQNRHQDVLDAALAGLERTLDENQESLRERFGHDSPWWLPGAVEDRIFDRLLDGVRRLLHDINTDPDHEIRKRFDVWVEDFADRLEHSDDLAARGDDLKRELLAQPELRRWISSLWTEAKTALRSQAADPDSELRRRLSVAVAHAGRRLHDDPALRDKAEQLVESAVSNLAERFHDEVGALVTSTIARWDGQETSDKLELLLGPDLQFIRINGTVVGGLAGLVIFTLLRAF